MSSNSAIEWTEATWNPVTGCTMVSPGCTNCYAMTMAGRLEAMGQKKYAGTTKKIGKRAVWTGKMNLIADDLDIPLRRKKPTMYFVNSMSDLFHEGVPFDFIDKVFAVMALTPQHTYQILTKRPERMAEYLADLAVRVQAWDAGEGETEEFLITMLHDADVVEYPIMRYETNRLYGPSSNRLMNNGEKLKDSKGGNVDEWPQDLRVREFPKREAVPA